MTEDEAKTKKRAIITKLPSLMVGPKTERLSVRLSYQARAALFALADARGVSMAELVSQMIEREYRQATAAPAYNLKQMEALWRATTQLVNEMPA